MLTTCLDVLHMRRLFVSEVREAVNEVNHLHPLERRVFIASNILSRAYLTNENLTSLYALFLSLIARLALETLGVTTNLEPSLLPRVDRFPV